MLATPNLATVPTAVYIPTGPDNASIPILPVIKLQIIISIITTILTNFLNAYLIEATKPVNFSVGADIPIFLPIVTSFSSQLFSLNIFSLVFSSVT